MNIAEAIEKSQTLLPGENPALEAQVLLGHVLGQPRSWVLAHPEVDLSISQQSELNSGLSRLAGGEPLPYVVGHWEFYGLDFEVTPVVLIPRPETELLVDIALNWLERRPDCRSAVDVGTGSGCIAISLAAKIQTLKLVATDLSSEALEVARRNAEKFSVLDRVEFCCCDLLPPEGRTYDLILANLPYIPSDTMKNLSVYGREPTLALDGGEDGLDLVRRLIALAPDCLSPGGMVLLEIESGQGMAALSLAYDTFTHASIHLHQDLSGRDRLLEIQTHAGSDRLG